VKPNLLEGRAEGGGRGFVRRTLKRVREDIEAVFERDPAARNLAEVVLCYPGMHAVWVHRITHWLWTRDRRLAARLVSQVARFATGVEIHPGASIGRRFFIDHGMGVVIGETAEVGDDCTIYHQVTLGGTSWKREKRHPTLGDNVVVGAGAAILGPYKIGDNTKVGAGSVVVAPVPKDSSVVGVPGKVTFRRSTETGHYDINQTDLPDPVVKALECLAEEVRELEAEVRELKAGGKKRKPGRLKQGDKGKPSDPGECVELYKTDTGKRG
jgi:serine O-acetyltransferase